MKIYSFTGPSGTGKSYQAGNLCKQMNIESIIDDGLFICRNKVEAGISAKRQPTKLGAVKTALFFTDEHKNEVEAAIRKINPESMLVLGTSDEMVDRIIARLGLEPPIKRIYIEDITTEEEREEAHRQRHELGKHVIPVPTFQIRRQFSGYFMSPMRIFRDFGHWNDSSEKSVVRPAFSYMGKYNISEKVMGDIVECIKQELGTVDDVVRVTMIKDQSEPDEGINIKVIVNMKLVPELLEETVKFQKTILEKIREMTAFHVKRVDLEIKELVSELAESDPEVKEEQDSEAKA